MAGLKAATAVQVSGARVLRTILVNTTSNELLEVAFENGSAAYQWERMLSAPEPSATRRAGGGGGSAARNMAFAKKLERSPSEPEPTDLEDSGKVRNIPFDRSRRVSCGSLG